MTISAAVLGRPITHSKSPLLHRAAFRALGLDEAQYRSFDLGVDELDSFLASHRDQIGFSLTMPLKERLVELAHIHGWELDDTAGLTGVANTLVRRDTTTLVSNTDVQGIVRALEPSLGSRRRPAEASDRATVLGAGATAASALLACRELGMTTVEFLVRNPDRADHVLELGRGLGMSVSTAPLSLIAPSALVISTLPAEAVPELRWSPGRDGGVALDVAYASESSFLRAAETHGLTPIEGTMMLVEQAVAQSAMFVAAAGDRATSGNDPEDENLRSIIAEAMYRALDGQSASAHG
ncbi:shikimate dehydrogenase family protein [Brevibacterium marinum]|uniref:Shikimate dehydrogenase n=1 Tax=Brevibacterium marinum TaxID=418643 RepID=A0A846S035_9MICO|nr:shikimate dehydrogenase [Brevibacterium marinum]NJC57566.1 shikimate dehydrogenase [Brevibacterium marinum]